MEFSSFTLSEPFMAFARGHDGHTRNAVLKVMPNTTNRRDQISRQFAPALGLSTTLKKVDVEISLSGQKGANESSKYITIECELVDYFDDFIRISRRTYARLHVEGMFRETVGAYSISGLKDAMWSSVDQDQMGAIELQMHTLYGYLPVWVYLNDHINENYVNADYITNFVDAQNLPTESAKVTFQVYPGGPEVTLVVNSRQNFRVTTLRKRGDHMEPFSHFFFLLRFQDVHPLLNERHLLQLHGQKFLAQLTTDPRECRDTIDYPVVGSEHRIQDARVSTEMPPQGMEVTAYLSCLTSQIILDRSPNVQSTRQLSPVPGPIKNLSQLDNGVSVHGRTAFTCFFPECASQGIEKHTFLSTFTGEMDQDHTDSGGVALSAINDILKVRELMVKILEDIEQKTPPVGIESCSLPRYVQLDKPPVIIEPSVLLGCIQQYNEVFVTKILQHDLSLQSLSGGTFAITQDNKSILGAKCFFFCPGLNIERNDGTNYTIQISFYQWNCFDKKKSRHIADWNSWREKGVMSTRENHFDDVHVQEEDDTKSMTLYLEELGLPSHSVFYDVHKFGAVLNEKSEVILTSHKAIRSTSKCDVTLGQKMLTSRVH